jgi:hypothetical protein
VRSTVRNAFTALTAALLGCGGATSGAAPATPSLTRVGSAVQVTDRPMQARECQFITDLAVQSTNPADAEAIITLRNDAGTAGANLVLLVMATRTTIERAEGYLCAD